MSGLSSEDQRTCQSVFNMDKINAMGVSRSSTICIAYFIKHKHLSYQDAFDKVKAARRQIKPNAGFVKKLKAL